MQKHPQKRICKATEISEELLTFKLTKEQQKRANGAKITFRKSTQRYAEKGYRQLIARAEFNGTTASGKKRAKTAASKLIGIIWDDEPEWVYETDKSKSSIPERREEARTRRAEAQRKVAAQISSFFADHVEYTSGAVIVKKMPIELFLTVAVACSTRGLTDATTVANYWNTNLSTLQAMYPSLQLEEISHDTVRRIYMSLTENCVRNFISKLYEWLPKSGGRDRRHYAVDGQACRASRNEETFRPMMMLNAVDVTAGKLCASHLMIDAKRHEPTHAPDLLKDFELSGATVTFDALNTTPTIAKTITDAGAFYLLALKGNQPKLSKATKSELEEAAQLNGLIEEWGKAELKHNRIDERGYLVVPASFLPDELTKRWPGLKEGCIVRATTKSMRQKKTGYWGHSKDVRYFITNHPWKVAGEPDGAISEWLKECVRGHWGVESFHWSMDAVWKQDQMQCKYPEYLRMRETLAKIGHNLVQTMRNIEQEEKGLSKPRSGAQMAYEVGVTLESALTWFGKIFAHKERKPGENRSE